MTDKLKNIVLIFFVVAAFGFAYLYFTKKEVMPYDKDLIDSQINDLKRENNQLKKNIEVSQARGDQWRKVADSLSDMEPKIKVIYVEKNKEIDNADANAVVNEFNGIFTANGIK